MKLGVLGGSFNPIHYGHVSMAEAVRKAHALDLVIFVPAGRPPHKRGDLAGAEDRLHMVRLAIEGREGLAASDIEVRRAGTSYTVDTLEEVHRLYPGAEVFFIVGEDSIPELPTWREPARIVRLARIIAVNRPGSRAAFRLEDYPGVPPGVVERMERDRVRMEPSPLESRSIRAAIREGRSITGMVPEPVAAYILAHGLYRT